MLQGATRFSKTLGLTAEGTHPLKRRGEGRQAPVTRERVQGVCTQLALYTHTHTHCRWEYYHSNRWKRPAPAAKKGERPTGGGGLDSGRGGRGMNTAPLIINK